LALSEFDVTFNPPNRVTLVKHWPNVGLSIGPMSGFQHWSNA